MNNKIITGQINDQVTFVAENFRFTFVSVGNKSVLLSADENGYIWGKTHNFKYIGIYTGKDIELQFGTRVVNVWHYILLDSIIPEQLTFNAIKFENGAINIVNPCNALQKDFDKEEELNKEEELKGGNSGKVKNGRREKYYVYKGHPDSKEFTVPTVPALPSENEEDETVKWIFTSKIEQSMSIDAGDTLKNDTSALLIVFEKEKKLNTFIDYYRYVTDILAFLTFRRNIYFKNISLEYTVPGQSMSTVADCYIKSPDDYYNIYANGNIGNIANSSIATIKNRNVMEVIRIKMLDDAVFTKLVTNVINGDLPMSIIPEDGNAVYRMSGDTIKNVCSALEVELDSAEINASRSQDLKELIDSVKSVIKQHQKEKNSLGEKTYSVLFGSIKHWGDSLADRIIIAWRQKQNILQPMLNRWYSSVILPNQSIIDLVKARNDITHRAVQHIDDDVCNTAFLMYSLIYCMALKRLGVEDSTIAVILENGLVG